MKTWILAVVAVAGIVGTADAALTTLETITSNGASDNSFTYQITLGPDEGLRSGDRFVIFDFAGYIGGSIFATAANFTTSVENISINAITLPGQDDDPSLANLVFVYNGADFRATGGPLPSFDLNSFGARSTLSGTFMDAFFAQTTKNNPPTEADRASFTVGTVRVPASAVPEPATWAMVLGGFALLGASTRRRARRVHVTN